MTLKMVTSLSAIDIEQHTILACTSLEGFSTVLMVWASCMNRGVDLNPSIVKSNMGSGPRELYTLIL